VESRFAQYVGRTAPPVTYEIERGHIRRFADAIGDPDPIYRGEGRVPAPPTFATALRPNDPREGLDIDFRKLLHGEQEFSYARPLYAGDRITLTARISDASVKEGKSGAMDLMTVESRAVDERGELVFTARSLVVIRR
jgi:acyl dehydratase